MFRKDGAFPYDERVLSWDLGSESVWLRRVAGRRRMPLEGGERERTRLERQPGESDLIRHRKASSWQPHLERRGEFLPDTDTTEPTPM